MEVKQIPKQDGRWFTGFQRAIIASGFSETERVREAQRIGAGKYVKKPYTIEKIGMAIKSELSRPQKAA